MLGAVPLSSWLQWLSASPERRESSRAEQPDVSRIQRIRSFSPLPVIFILSVMVPSYHRANG